MNEKAKQWVAELRSGKYEQGQGFLRTASDKFCCLGVLCDILYPEGWNDFKFDRQNYIFSKIVSDDEGSDFLYSDVAMPPEVLINEVGLFYGDARDLADMNDEGYSFDEIADEIELLLE